MKHHQAILLATGFLAGLLALVVIPNTSWNLSVFAQVYGSLESVTIQRVDITDLSGGSNARPVAYGLGPITDELAYRENAPQVATLMNGSGEIQLFNVPPTANIYPPAGTDDSPDPVKVRTVNTLTIQHYYLLSINDVYLYQVNIYDSGGSLIDENLMYFVYPDGIVFWFYFDR